MITTELQFSSSVFDAHSRHLASIVRIFLPQRIKVLHEFYLFDAQTRISAWLTVAYGEGRGNQRDWSPQSQVYSADGLQDISQPMCISLLCVFLVSALEIFTCMYTNMWIWICSYVKVHVFICEYTCYSCSFEQHVIYLVQFKTAASLVSCRVMSSRVKIHLYKWRQ